MSARVVSIAAMIGVTVVAQLALKAGSSRPALAPLPIHPLVLGGLALMLVVSLLSVYALSQSSLATVTAWASLIYPLTLIGARLVLKERFARRAWLGLALICAGVALYAFAPPPP